MNKIIFLISLALLAASCTGPTSDITALDDPQPQIDLKPVVEAFIEYPGPQDKWAGPMTLMVHVDAKNAEAPAQITVTPPIVGAPRVGATLKERAPASAEEATPSSKSSEVREQLMELANVVETFPTEFTGCMYPIRVRLVHEDGAITEKSGCRGAGWAQAASDKVSRFLASVPVATQH